MNKLQHVMAKNSGIKTLKSLCFCFLTPQKSGKSDMYKFFKGVKKLGYTTTKSKNAMVKLLIELC